MTDERSSEEVSQSQPQADYDNPWKDGLEEYLQQFLELCFPGVHALIDWAREYESLEQEMQQVAWDAEVGKRIADKLFKVWLREGQEAYVLIHVEVQNQEETGFAERMYVYNYRCFDRHRRPVLSLAVLGDERSTWRPSSYGYAYDRFRLVLEFPIMKLIDYESQWEQLEQSENPFAALVMAHLKTKATIGQPRERKQWKWRLVRRLYELNYQRRDILKLFQLIDWMMTLPVELQQEFKQQVRRYEEDRQMPVISRIELMAKEEGMELGSLRTARESVVEVLEVRFGTVPPALLEAIAAIADVARLKQLLRQAIAIGSLEEFLQVLTPAENSDNLQG